MVIDVVDNHGVTSLSAELADRLNDWSAQGVKGVVLSQLPSRQPIWELTTPRALEDAEPDGYPRL